MSKKKPKVRLYQIVEIGALAGKKIVDDLREAGITEEEMAAASKVAIDAAKLSVGITS
jgi:hypothetical protein